MDKCNEIWARPTVYLAAPLFNPNERAFNRDLRDRLEAVANVFLPQEDGALVVDMVRAGIATDVARKRVFDLDVSAIRRADVLLAVLDGRSVDEGVAFELGVAFALGKVCWGMKTDDRALLPSGDNPMITEALCKCFSDAGDITRELMSFDTISSR